jgi:hypothetical protein
MKEKSGERGSGLLGRVKHFLVRYEFQGRDSLHAHIVLWIHNDDIARGKHDICVNVPGVWDTERRVWKAGNNRKHSQFLLHLILEKQIHMCRDSGCKSKGTCQYGTIP